MSDYRKFKATSTILPGVTTIEYGSGAADPVNSDTSMKQLLCRGLALAECYRRVKGLA